ncbi:MAG: tRNA 2-thiouridine(34) synthase MnmA [Candidatus Omnitrophota bacterium]|nr:tRNA 2-thiouridine(34) synthase MnmA [Candidatus Omnitrophota bacterium]MBU1928642.1 tRNA 2-thiouridine(34) synthase MnmA [Candidatus Omnitrophota bacterium]MBU2034740.1 tRNA 2-thiouridine(34) synthase MnmA [Candidatus Omnitrophota bacterium]MBU2222084.1 tRNA 2-thiouridine(34) synthase MnmA [Candidatus Omnitrophota bacterium]MBU2257664.1 tRNA 2-thiouridine(34) synthase MnmA [Candidatus Omnitrophota bacterium]
MKKKVIVAMSGGVDSSTAAYLLKKNGFEVVGVTMCLGVNPAESKKAHCCGAKEIEDAKAVCRKISIPHYVFDFSKALKEKVIANFIDEYSNGRTPNPCVVCNRELKFGSLLKKAKALGFSLLATGHYARLGRYKGKSVIKKPKDRIKDQTYFLYSINKKILDSVIFPLEGYAKAQVREIARRAGLPVADKPQSQDICFIPDKNYKKYLLQMGIKLSPGDIVDEKGKILGRHKGLVNYTIGQRAGLGVGSLGPLYVKALDTKRNSLVVAGKNRIKAKGLIAEKFNLHVDRLPEKVWVKIRYGHVSVKSRVFLKNGCLRVIFGQPQEAVTPGQSVVLYDKEVLLGGGIIKQGIY